MNFVRKLSTIHSGKSKKIIFDSHIYNFVLSQNSREIVDTINGTYKISTNIKENNKKIKKYELPESHSPDPFIRVEKDS